MNLITHRRCFSFGIIVSAVVLALNACQAAPTQTATPIVDIPALKATLSQPPAPTTAADSPAVILLAPQQADGDQKNQIDGALKDLSTQTNVSYGVLESLTAEQVTSATKLIVVMAPDPGLAGLAQALPKVSFLGLGISLGDSLPANVDVLTDAGISPEISAFTAGYIAAQVTDEWQVGALGDSNTPAGQAAVDGFINGAEFFCGLCNPSHPPFTDFPTSGSLSTGASQADAAAAVDALVKAGVKTLYVPSELSTPDLLTYAAEQGMNLIGTQTPPEAVRPQWIVTIGSDLGGTVRTLWPDLMAGKAGVSVKMKPGLMDINSSLVTAGKQRLINDVIQSLVDGDISARSVQTQ
jgi:hypothetical protein